MIALAAQRYGLIVRDGSGNVSIDGQVPESPAQNGAWQRALTASGFQSTRRSSSHSPGATCSSRK
jgi:hypothetical protein